MNIMGGGIYYIYSKFHKETTPRVLTAYFNSTPPNDYHCLNNHDNSQIAYISSFLPFSSYLYFFILIILIKLPDFRIYGKTGFFYLNQNTRSFR